jgi:hypothetical protein
VKIQLLPFNSDIKPLLPVVEPGKVLPARREDSEVMGNTKFEMVRPAVRQAHGPDIKKSSHRTFFF